MLARADPEVAVAAGEAVHVEADPSAWRQFDGEGEARRSPGEPGNPDARTARSPLPGRGGCAAPTDGGADQGFVLYGGTAIALRFGHRRIAAPPFP